MCFCFTKFPPSSVDRLYYVKKKAAISIFIKVKRKGKKNIIIENKNILYLNQKEFRI